MVENEENTLKQLREKLDYYGYSEAISGETNPNSNIARPFLEHKFKENNPSNAIVNLFFVGTPVETKQVRNLLGSDLVNALADLNILDIGQEFTRAQLMIFHYSEYLFMCDFMRSRTKEKRNYEPVYAPGGDSLQLAQGQLTSSVNSTLDLCTGCGIQAIIASKYSQHVTGIDLNPRAISFAKRNLVLNSITNVEFKQGSLFDPIGAEKYDLILANPPFVISPSKTALYRDGGDMGDEILLKILEGVLEHLDEAGYCMIITFLSEFDGYSHEKYLEAFARKHSCEVLILSSPPFDKYQFARQQHLNQIIDYEKYRKRVVDFLDHLHRVKFQKGYSSLITLGRGKVSRFKHLKYRKTAHFDINIRDRIADYFNLAP